MTAYYNEIEPYAAQWLRNLIQEGLIADGEVDTRSIVDVRPSDLDGFDQCHFFAGLGGWSGALRLAGVADAEPLWTGSCPCQPFSLAGKQKGFDDERHLWPVWRELIRERRPAKVFGEQVASASEWLGLVRSDLEAMGYAVGAIPCEAASAGADHLRDRYWFVADALCDGSGDRSSDRYCPQEATFGIDRRSSRAGSAIRLDGAHDVADSEVIADPRERIRKEPQRLDYADLEWCNGSGELSWVIGADGKARRVKSGIRLLAHGVPARVAKLRALGNAIDLRPAAAFIDAAMSVHSIQRNSDAGS